MLIIVNMHHFLARFFFALSSKRNVTTNIKKKIIGPTGEKLTSLRVSKAKIYAIMLIPTPNPVNTITIHLKTEKSLATIKSPRTFYKLFVYFLSVTYHKIYQK